MYAYCTKPNCRDSVNVINIYGSVHLERPYLTTFFFFLIYIIIRLLAYDDGNTA